MSRHVRTQSTRESSKGSCVVKGSEMYMNTTKRSHRSLQRKKLLALCLGFLKDAQVHCGVNRRLRVLAERSVRLHHVEGIAAVLLLRHGRRRRSPRGSFCRRRKRLLTDAVADLSDLGDRRVRCRMRRHKDRVRNRESVSTIRGQRDSRTDGMKRGCVERFPRSTTPRKQHYEPKSMRRDASNTRRRPALENAFAVDLALRGAPGAAEPVVRLSS